MEAIRVLIADDHQQFRAGLRALMASATDLELAGEAIKGEQSLASHVEIR
jgi:DNA-binding NarL/FixJ family response regulator